MMTVLKSNLQIKKRRNLSHFINKFNFNSQINTESISRCRTTNKSLKAGIMQNPFTITPAGKAEQAAWIWHRIYLKSKSCLQSNNKRQTPKWHNQYFTLFPMCIKTIRKLNLPKALVIFMTLVNIWFPPP